MACKLQSNFIIRNDDNTNFVCHTSYCHNDNIFLTTTKCWTFCILIVSCDTVAQRWLSTTTSCNSSCGEFLSENSPNLLVTKTIFWTFADAAINMFQFACANLFWIAIHGCSANLRLESCSDCAHLQVLFIW